MVEDHHLAHIGGLTDLACFLPCGMAPALLGRIFLIGIGGIIDHDVGILRQLQDIFVQTVGEVLGIGDDGDRLVLVFQTITGAAIGVVERCRMQLDPLIWGQNIALGEPVEFGICLKGIDADRQQRVGHHVGDDLAQIIAARQMPGADPHPVFRIIGRAEKRQADDVIQMSMGQVNVVVVTAIAIVQPTEAANAGTGVEDDIMLAASDLDTGGVPAVT